MPSALPQRRRRNKLRRSFLIFLRDGVLLATLPLILVVGMLGWLIMLLNPEEDGETISRE